MADKKRQILLSEDKSEEHKPSWASRVEKAIKGKMKIKGGVLSYEPTKVDSFMAGKRRSHPKGKRHFGVEYERKF
jgi:hypothetical protein